MDRYSNTTILMQINVTLVERERERARIYDEYMRHTLLYAMETRVLTKKMEEILKCVTIKC